MDNYAAKSEVQEDISAEADKHQVLNKQLDEAISYLESSLDRVLIPEKEKAILGDSSVSYAINAAPAPSQPRSKLSVWMSRRNDVLERAIERINNLRTRLDII